MTRKQKKKKKKMMKKVHASLDRTRKG